MPRRLYFSTAAAPVTPPAADAAWQETAGSNNLALVRTPDNTALTTVTRAEAVTTTNYSVLLRRFVSEPLAAQTITGTVVALLRARESNAAGNMSGEMTVKVITGDGSTVRGTLYAHPAHTTNAEEWTTTLSARPFPRGASITPANVTSVSAQAGDRLLIELGYVAVNTSSTSYSGELSIGAPTAGADLSAVAETATNRGWLEFSQDLVFQGELSATLTDAATSTDAMGGALALPPTTDTAAAGDALIALVGRTETLDDSAVAADALTATLDLAATGFTESLSDSAGAADLIGGALALPATEDPVTASDSIAETLIAPGAWSAQLDDGAAATDAVGVTVGSPTLSDAAIATDAVVPTLRLLELASDTAGATDTVQSGLAASLDDGASAADSLVAPLRLFEPVTDAASSADATTIGQGAALADAADAADAVTPVLRLVAALEDTATAGDAVTPTLQATGTLTEIVADVALVGDLVGGQLHVPALLDSVSAADAVTATLSSAVGLAEILADGATAADAAGHTLTLPSLSDDAQVTDDVRPALMPATLLDTAAGSDGVTATLHAISGAGESLPETATATDAVAVGLVVPGGDAATAAELLVVGQAIAAADAAVGSDELRVGETRGCADAAAASDLALVQQAIALADAAAAADEVLVVLVAPTSQVLADGARASDAVEAMLIGPVRITVRPDDGYAIRLAGRDAPRVQLTADDRFGLVLKFHRFNPWGVAVNQPDLVPDNDYEGSFDASSRNDAGVWKPRLGLTGHAWVSETDNGAEVDPALRVALVAYAQRSGAYRFTLQGSAITAVSASRGWADGRALWLVLADPTGVVRISQPRTFRLARRG